LGVEAIGTIQKLVARLDDSCGFERKNSLYLASRKRDVSELKREPPASVTAGLPTVDDGSTAVDELRRPEQSSPGSFLGSGEEEYWGSHSAIKIRLTVLM
jgi:hypothetical protein